MNNSDLMDRVKEIYLNDSESNTQYINVWSEEILFTWRWWLSFAMTVLPWILWIIVRKKESTARLLGVAFFTMFLTAWMDFVGVDLGLWYYPIDTIPFVPSFIPYDFCILPVMVTLMIQYKPHISPFWKAAAFTLFNTYIAEPALEYLEFYEEFNWHTYYSLPLYFLIYLLAHWLSRAASYERVV